MPFILRGVGLLGIDSGHTPIAERQAIWDRLAADLRPPHLDDVTRVIALDALPPHIDVDAARRGARTDRREGAAGLRRRVCLAPAARSGRRGQPRLRGGGAGLGGPAGRARAALGGSMHGATTLNVGGLLDEHARLYPDRLAVVCGQITPDLRRAPRAGQPGGRRAARARHRQRRSRGALVPEHRRISRPCISASSRRAPPSSR